MPHQKRPELPVHLLPLERANPGFLQKLVDRFQGNTVDELRLLDEKLKHGEPLELRKILHRMKSSSRMMGATEFGDACERLEKTVESLDGSEREKQIRALIADGQWLLGNLPSVQELLAKNPT